ncbi:UNVERIFIED_CONTAM: hypothetical protein DVV46_11245 [Lactobacillus paragasseri]|nr:hypothetical protein [Lactobacillus paragasseri]
MDRAEATLGALLELVEGAINEGDTSPQVLREASGVARAIVAAQAERRASAKARAYTAANLPPEIVMAHLRGLTPDARGRIVTELLAIDNEGSVLA